jgi:LmbE family N-acetylglucosaminyl deacetylase
MYRTSEAPQSTATDFGLHAGQHVLFVHAHPDDETIATGHAIRALSASGVNVHRAGYRRIEAMLALRELGVSLDNQHFFSLEDGKLSDERNNQEMALTIGALLLNGSFAAIFTPGAEGFDGHDDHIAVHNATLNAVATTRSGGAVWSLGDTPGNVFVPADPTAKLLAAEYHATQYPNVYSELAIGILQPYRQRILTGEHYHRQYAILNEGDI